MKIRKAAVAGTFYPNDKTILSNYIDKLLSETIEPKKTISNIRAIISPHAGIMYSGIVAASGYRLLRNQKINRIIILGPSHYVPIDFASLSTHDFYETPLGKTKIDQIFQKKLITDAPDDFRNYEPAHLKEHSIEVQLPFLQKVLKNFQIVPIVVGEINYKNITEVINKYIDEKTLIIASSDLSHYHQQEIANQIDKQSIEAILSQDSNIIRQNTDACGIYPILTLNEIAKSNKWQPKLLDYKTSGDVTGDKTAVVGYAGIIYIK